MDERARTVSESELLAPLQALFDSHKISVIDWQEQPLTAVGTSTAGVTRLTGRAHVDGYERPWSVVRKKVTAPATEASGSSATETLSSPKYWKREKLVYESGLLDALPHGMAAPRGLRIAEEPDGYSLWTEDVGDEIETKWPLSFYEAAADHIGRLHGTYLTRLPVPVYPWLCRDVARERERNVISRQQLNELRQDPIMLRGWPDDVAEGILAIWQERAQFFKVRERLPQVFQHGDFIRRNLFARRTKNGDAETVAIDWQFAGIGTVGEDLACLVCSSVLWFFVPPDQLQELEEIAFDAYMRALRDAGWQGDTRWVRLGYTIEAATRYSLIYILEAPSFRKRLEAVMPQSIEEVADNMVFLRRYLIQRAAEARQLMASLPLQTTGTAG